MPGNDHVGEEDDDDGKVGDDVGHDIGDDDDYNYNACQLFRRKGRKDVPQKFPLQSFHNLVITVMAMSIAMMTMIITVMAMVITMVIMTITMMAMINLVIAVTLMFKANPNESVEDGDGKGGFY